MLVNHVSVLFRHKIFAHVDIEYQHVHIAAGASILLLPQHLMTDAAQQRTGARF